MGFRFVAAKFSSCELDYLKAHLEDPVMQLAGYLGKSANAIKVKTKEIITGVVATKKRSSKGTKIGKRADLGLFLRSGWEADFMRYLKHITTNEIQYEPITFTFTQFGIKHGTVSYTPDFKQIDPFGGAYCWYEVKGYLKAEDKVKLNRFKKYFPEEFSKLIAVCGGPTSATAKFFAKLGVDTVNFLELKKKFKDIIPHWES